MYYLINKDTKQIIMALPSQEHIIFLKDVYQKRGVDCYVSHLSLIVNEVGEELGYEVENGQKVGS